MKTVKTLLKKHRSELMALLLLFVGAPLGMLGLIQRVPLVLGILGIALPAAGLLYFCIKYTSEKTYKEYYKDSYEIEHNTIADEIRKSMTYHRYQDAVVNRFESVCRDLGISDEQRDWILTLLMAEKNKVDESLRNGEGEIIL